MRGQPVLRPLAFLDGHGGDEISEERATWLAWRDELKKALGALSWCLAVENYPEWAYWWDGTSLQSAPHTLFRSRFAKVWNAVLLTPSWSPRRRFPGGDLRFWSGKPAWSRPIRSFSNPPFPCGADGSLGDLNGDAVPDPGYDQRVAEIVEKLVNRTGEYSCPSLVAASVEDGWRAAHLPKEGIRHFPSGKPAEGGIAASIQGRPCIRPGGECVLSRGN